MTRVKEARELFNYCKVSIGYCKSDLMTDIKMIKNVDISGYTLIEGFPGLGLVGPMAISYMIDKLGMEYIGYITSEKFPPIISIHKSEAMPPVRLYASKEHKIVSIFAEFAIAAQMVKEVGDVVYQFLQKSGIKRVICIGGLPAAGAESDMTYAIASNQSELKLAKAAGITPIVDGVSAGVSAILITDAIADKKPIPITNILVPVDQSIVDPRYAELAIKSIDRLLGLKIDVSELETEAKEVEEKVQELLKKSKESHEEYKKISGTGGDDKMYG